jgi:hypothetical protein
MMLMLGVFPALFVPEAIAALTVSSQPPSGCPRPLPGAGGRSFADLDSYLAFRREGGASDMPYYEEVSPDVFQLMLGRGHGGDAPKLFTRAELLAEFCFER